jgi:hypothetical protein
MTTSVHYYNTEGDLQRLCTSSRRSNHEGAGEFMEMVLLRYEYNIANGILRTAVH